jgi:hypothetical protein
MDRDDGSESNPSEDELSEKFKDFGMMKDDKGTIS